jgi:N-acetylneuraminic acid mutarotase
MKKILLLLMITFFVGCSKEDLMQEPEVVTQEPEVVTQNPIDPIQEILNINEDKFSFTSKSKKSMPFPSYDFGAELYKGKIYAFLATDDYYYYTNNSYGKVCVYDIEKDVWQTINNIPQYQAHASSTIIGDKIYLIGAYGFKKTIQVYNITKNTWEQSLSLPIGSYWSTVETINDKIYIFGGYAEEVNGSGIRFLSTVQIYNPKTNEWTFGAEMPEKIQSPNSMIYNNEVYVWDLNLMLKYNPATNNWTYVNKLQSYSKASQEGIAIDDYLFFISGQNGHGFKDKASNKIYLYNPKTDNYVESINDLSIGRHYNYAVFEYKKKIYILGGREDQEWNAMDDVIEIAF